MTRQRRAILEALGKTASHPTAGETYDMIRKKLPRISLGTVYRNLEMLSETGHIRRLELNGTRNRFDARTDRHYHLRCLNCGLVLDLNLPPQTQVELLANELNNCLITGHHLEFTGLCSLCREELKK